MATACRSRILADQFALCLHLGQQGMCLCRIPNDSSTVQNSCRNPLSLIAQKIQYPLIKSSFCANRAVTQELELLCDEPIH